MASVSRLQLSFLGGGLRDKDVFTKSDPYLLLYEIQSNGREKLLGRTETIKNDLNPVWLKRFEVDFLFEARQDFIAKIYDDDGKGVIGDDYLGHVAFPLASVVSGRHGKCEKAIEGVGKKGGRLVLCAQPIVGLGADTLALRFFGTGFKEMAWIGTCDPYLKLYFLQSNGAKVLLHQTAVIKGTVAPHWSPTPALLVSQMATDLNVRTLLVECWHKHLVFDGFIGQFTVSVNELLANSGLPATFELHRPKKPHKIYGRVGVSFAHLHHPPTFLEYLTAGMVMNLTVAIDFTASNGDPRHQSSLHYLNPMRPNQYVQAIQSVGSIVLDYDTDKLVPAFGFGGSVRHVTSHCFHLNAHPDPNVLGLQGILDAYGAALANVPLSGPTNFAPTIRKAAEVARITERGLIYQILVIITDGAITDTDDTIDAIVAAADLPLSIIIIGVGNADFSTMVMLDGDDVRITDSRGKPASRDIVQFVAFRDFANGPVENLAAEVLREVPRQVETWAASLNVTPQLVSERREHSLSFLSTL